MVYGNPVGEFYGGISTHVRYLTKFLQKTKDLQLVIVTFGDTNRTYKKGGIEYIELKRIKFGMFIYPVEIFYDTFRLEQAIKKINPDIIHIQSTSPNLSLFGILMKKKYPMVMTIHGYFAEEYKIHTGWRKIGYKLICVPIEKRALNTIPYLIVLSPQIKEIISKITKSKIHMISNGIDINFIQTIDSHERKDYPTVFFLGYITKGKGVEDLIKAIELAKKKVENIKLLIGGIGQHMTELENLVQDMNLKENVTFLGLLNEKEKFAYMKSIDIFVLPSYWESSPIVLLEALACGKPIITTNVGGNSSVVTHNENGFLVQPGDWHQISEYLIFLLNNKDRLNNIEQNNKKKSLDYNWETITQQTRNVYTEIYNESKNEMRKGNSKNN